MKNWPLERAKNPGLRYRNRRDFRAAPLANFSSFLGILILLLLGCSPEPQPPKISELSGIAMTVPYHITFSGQLDARSLNRANRLVEGVFQEINAVFNQWNPSSEISALNRLKAGVRVTPSSSLYRLLLLVDQVYRLTDGYYDPTVEPLRQLWMPYLSEGLEPPSESLAAISPKIGWHRVHLVDGQFWKDHDDLHLTLDSLSKGLCIDLLVEQLNASGFHNVLVEWGGEIRACGRHSQQRPWRVFISRLGSTHRDEAIAEIDLEDKATATSGDYLQYWMVGNKTYFHIFDPKTLYPLMLHQGSIASATVLAPSCVLADALATSALLFGSIEEAQAWANQVQENTTFWFVTRK